MDGLLIDVETQKYGGHPHYSFQVRRLAESGSLWIVVGEFGRTLVHHTKKMVIKVENRSLEYYWRDRPYTVAVDCDPDGAIRRYYCNVNLPPVMEPGRITWVDLDLDLLVTPALTYQVVDEDEFRANAIRYGYPPEVAAVARQGLAQLIQLVGSRSFPFDGSAERLARSTFGPAPGTGPTDAGPTGADPTGADPTGTAP